MLLYFLKLDMLKFDIYLRILCIVVFIVSRYMIFGGMLNNPYDFPELKNKLHIVLLIININSQYTSGVYL